MRPRAYFRPERAKYKHERVDFRPKRADFGPKRTGYGPRNVDFRSKRADLRTERVALGLLELISNLNRLPKGNLWSAMPVTLLCMIVNWSERKQGSSPKRNKVL